MVRHDWLDQNIFEPREEALEIQHDRLNMAIGGIKLADKNSHLIGGLGAGLKEAPYAPYLAQKITTFRAQLF